MLLVAIGVDEFIIVFQDGSNGVVTLNALLRVVSIVKHIQFILCDSFIYDL